MEYIKTRLQKYVIRSGYAKSFESRAPCFESLFINGKSLKLVWIVFNNRYFDAKESLEEIEFNNQINSNVMSFSSIVVEII